MPIITINESGAGDRLDRFLATKIETSRSQIQKLIKQGSITVNDRAAKSKTLLKSGDRVFYTEPETITHIKEEPVPLLDIVFEDEDMLVINKPTGLLVHEAYKNEHRATVIDWLLESHPETAQVGDNPTRPGIVHRLDKDVSGLMVIAKTQEAFEHLKHQFKTRTIKKTYLALAYGRLPKEHGTIKLKIARSKQKGRMVARTGEQEGKEAITKYDVLKRFATATYIQVRILTGRTHQIRVHFQALGYPIVGDKLYKVKHMKFSEIPLDRLFLHSHKLSFRLLNGKEKTFTIELPLKLENLLSKLPNL